MLGIGIPIIKVVRQYFQQKQIKVLEFVVKFRKPNIIANCWDHLARIAYAKSKQFQSTKGLETTATSALG